jgi:thiol-disulfide isomerase/thioredoxin
MKYRFSIFILLCALIILATGCTQPVTTQHVPNNELLTVNSTQDIDALLKKSPVFIEIGADWCSACKAQKPIIEELAATYGDRVKFVYINVDQQRQLATQFNVDYIPDMSIIVNKSDSGTYNYITIDGTLTDDRLKAMMIGFTQKEVLESTIEKALALRE